MNLSVNSDEGQKHAASLLEAHLGTESQVFKHIGTRSGQEGALGELGTADVVMGSGAVVCGCCLTDSVAVACSGQSMTEDGQRVTVTTWVIHTTGAVTIGGSVVGVDTFITLLEGLCDSTGTVGTITVDVEVDGVATRGPAGFGPEEQSKPI